MTQYLIAFPEGAMDHIPKEDMPAVSDAVRDVRRAAAELGQWVYMAGIGPQDPSVVAVDGTVTDGPFPETKEHLGGFTVVDVPTREDAIGWARRIAVACRCPQQVFELQPSRPD